MESPRILAFAGSLRSGSYNKQLVRLAAQAARTAGGEVTEIALLDFQLPLLNQDDEDARYQAALETLARMLVDMTRRLA